MDLLVIGNITLDKFYKLTRFPKPGETLIAKKKFINLGGKGLNQSITAARCGTNVSFISAIGKKDKTHYFSKYLKENNLDFKLIQKNGFTDESIIYTSKEGENSIVSTDRIIKKIEPNEIQDYLDQLNEKSTLLLQGSLSKKTTLYCLREAKKRSARVIVNFAPITYSCEEEWDKIDFLIINKEESKLLSDEEEKRDIIKFFKDSPLKNIIITLGENGVIIICESNIIKVPALKVKVKDTTGGGDVFTAVFTASILSHLNIKTACKRAVRAASIAITQEGSSDALPSKEELKIIMENT